MSRSYKKNYIVNDGKAKETKRAKRRANHVIRHTKDLPNKGNLYKRIYGSYNIHDYAFWGSWPEAKKWYETSPDAEYMKKKYPTLKAYYRWWIGVYKMK